MILYIDTSDFHNLTLALVTKQTIKKLVTEVAFNENYKTNYFLQKLLKHNKVNINKIQKIIVCSGPGSFTGLRVGASLAQALGFALQIPVTTIKKDSVPDDLSKLTELPTKKQVILHYGAKPNITKSNKKARF